VIYMCKYIHTCDEPLCPGSTVKCNAYHKFITRDRWADETKRPRIWAQRTIAKHQFDGYVIDDDITDVYIESLLLETKYVCPICDRIMSHSVGYGQGPCSPTIDDINNSHHLYRGNLRVVCSQCNLDKGARSDEMWLAGMKKQVARLEQLL
jgi:hypothetical protein